jgi:hypothetical protein
MNNGKRFENQGTETSYNSLEGCATKQSKREESQTENHPYRTNSTPNQPDFLHFVSATNQSALCASECLIPP